MNMNVSLKVKETINRQQGRKTVLILQCVSREVIIETGELLLFVIFTYIFGSLFYR